MSHPDYIYQMIYEAVNSRFPIWSPQYTEASDLTPTTEVFTFGLWTIVRRVWWHQRHSGSFVLGYCRLHWGDPNVPLPPWLIYPAIRKKKDLCHYTCSCLNIASALLSLLLSCSLLSLSVVLNLRVSTFSFFCLAVRERGQFWRGQLFKQSKWGCPHLVHCCVNSLSPRGQSAGNSSHSGVRVGAEGIYYSQWYCSRVLVLQRLFVLENNTKPYVAKHRVSVYFESNSKVIYTSRWGDYQTWWYWFIWYLFKRHIVVTHLVI